MATAEEALHKRVEELPDGLRQHVQRMVEEAVRLATTHGLDVGRVRVAALGHDMVRALLSEELLNLAKELGLEPNDVERAAPVLLHAPVAARLLATRFGIDDPEVLDAVCYHSTARAGMSDLEKVVFLADKTEPAAVAARPEWGEVRDLAQRDLDAALLKALDLYMGRALEEGWPLHADIVAARNHYLLRRG